MADEQSTTTAITIAGVIIPRDVYGRINLNALQQAGPIPLAKNPGQWLKRKSTQELIKELDSRVSFSTLDVVHGGEASGTYAHELLAISYAGWISPSFQLTVNQAFLDSKKKQSASELPTLHNPTYQMFIQTLIDLDATKHHVAQLEAVQHAQEAVQHAQALKLIETQQRTIEALQLSQGASAKADLAFEATSYLAVEEFVIKNSLLHQFPPSVYKKMSAWLKHFCEDYGLEIRKAPVYGKPWDAENAFPWQAFSAFLRYDKRRPHQIALVNKPTS